MKTFNLIITALIIGIVSVSCGGENTDKAIDTDHENSASVPDEDYTEELESEDAIEEVEEMEEVDEESANNEEWNEILDGYEEYMDDYIAIMKKQKDNPSDMDIMTEYTELMQKGTEWTTKMGDAAADFGPDQVARMLEIQAKLTSALY